MKTWLKFAVVFAFTASLGCAEKGKPAKDQSEKKISKAAPQKVTPTSTPVATTSRPTSRPAANKQGRLPPNHPPMGGPAVPAPPLQKAKGPTSGPTSAPNTGGGAPGIIRGRIQITEALRSRVKPGTTLFVSIRRFEGAGKRGMIMAAKKFPVGSATIFPLDFTVSQRDVMMGGTKLLGPVTVSARIDQDGDAISKQPGDIEGSHKGSLVVGKGSASVMLDVLRQ